MQHNLNPRLAEELRSVAVVPVLTIEHEETAAPLARALVAGGLRVLEVTLRTPAALAGLGRIARDVPEAVVGAGTVLTPAQAQQAIAAGARFLVSPGMTPRLVEAAEAWPVPFLPGAATPSEAMALSDLGYRVLKFFPAEPSGGVAALKALAAPLREIAFCPTGGIDLDRARSYLALPNVATVGGSWVAPAAAITAGDWATITQLAREAAALRLSR
ncbi:MAG: bifunctional 4-hydroxy-2-oxoglutarate aldolase/2-dehydro-3-deoxy-phosphogluconate aldolase [Hyphomicrobiaceae bacterium]|nr:bifunctional 4-hydroxy-2-oxoglutarate aldolase/2-dehydro-3-deoxy-phosphogluconate aldolase [Hyphomicrobiaceae bacterium]